MSLPALLGPFLGLLLGPLQSVKDLLVTSHFQVSWEALMPRWTLSWSVPWRGALEALRPQSWPGCAGSHQSGAL